MSFGAGSLGSKFFSTEGVAYNLKDYFLVKDDATLDEDIPLTLMMTKKLYRYESESEKDTTKKKRGVHNSESETDTEITVKKKQVKNHTNLLPLLENLKGKSLILQEVIQEIP